MASEDGKKASQGKRKTEAGRKSKPGCKRAGREIFAPVTMVASRNEVAESLRQPDPRSSESLPFVTVGVGLI